MKTAIELAKEAVEYADKAFPTLPRPLGSHWSEVRDARLVELARAEERKECIHAAEVAASLLNDPIAAIRARGQ